MKSRIVESIVWILAFFLIMSGIFIIFRGFLIKRYIPNSAVAENSSAPILHVKIPDVLRAVYFTSTTVANDKKISQFIDWSKKGGPNALISIPELTEDDHVSAVNRW